MKFDAYMMDKYVEEENPLDDQIADGYPEWLCELEPDDIIRRAELWCADEKLKLINRIEEAK